MSCPRHSEPYTLYSKIYPSPHPPSLPSSLSSNYPPRSHGVSTPPQLLVALPTKQLKTSSRAVTRRLLLQTANCHVLASGKLSTFHIKAEMPTFPPRHQLKARVQQVMMILTPGGTLSTLPSVLHPRETLSVRHQHGESWAPCSFSVCVYMFTRLSGDDIHLDAGVKDQFSPPPPSSPCSFIVADDVR